MDLDHEIDRARRTTSPLVVAYLDVVGLKTVNDALGHAAGDALAQRAVRAIRGHLRSYDLIVRLGGDKVGFAALEPEDSAAELIERADAELVATVAGRRAERHG